MSDFPAFEKVEGAPASAFVLLCDHASNALPKEYGTLGLNPAQLTRHIGYDIGARDTALFLAKHLNCPLIMSTYSRLLIDPNRGADDPTLIMRLSDGAIVPGNARVDDIERNKRITRFHAPYHQAIAQTIEDKLAKGITPIIISLHSFTPVWKTTPRPWHYGVLYDQDKRLASRLMDALEQVQTAPVGDNEPYTGQLTGDTMNVHGSKRGLEHALIEVRNDLIDTKLKAELIATFLAKVLQSIESA